MHTRHTDCHWYVRNLLLCYTMLGLIGQIPFSFNTLHLSLPHCQVAYHGAPQNAYAVFVEALRSKLITKMMLIPELEDKNPAGEGIEGPTFLT